MSNMSYCRFENTSKDLAECLDYFNDAVSASEKHYRKDLIALCVEIALDYGHEVGSSLVDE